jgi:hypothetical protein
VALKFQRIIPFFNKKEAEGGTIIRRKQMKLLWFFGRSGPSFNGNGMEILLSEINPVRFFDNRIVLKIIKKASRLQVSSTT